MGIKIQAVFDETDDTLKVRAFIRNPFGPEEFGREAVYSVEVNFDPNNPAPEPKLSKRLMEGDENTPANPDEARRVAAAIMPHQIDLDKSLDDKIAKVLREVVDLIRPKLERLGRKSAAIMNLAAENRGEFDQEPPEKQPSLTKSHKKSKKR